MADFAAQLTGHTDDPRDFPTEEIRELTLDEVKAILESELATSLGGTDSDISEQRRLAMRYYKGKPFGNEIEGRSKVVLRDVSDTVEWILPTLMRMFTGTNKLCRIEADKPGEAYKMRAKKGTLGVNHVLMKQNPGFMLLHTWMKDALLQKVGITKTYYEDKVEPRRDRFQGLTETELHLLATEDGLELTALDERVENLNGQDMVFYDVEVLNTRSRGRIRAVNVPPEYFRIAKRTVHLDDECTFSAEHSQVLASDLIAMGFDKNLVLSAPYDDEPDANTEADERFEDEEWTPDYGQDRMDPASRKLWITEAYIRIDEDGDGYSELRRILFVGSGPLIILDNQIVNHNPYSSLCPVPMPHKFFGESIADLVMDLQLIRSTLLRQMMDNLYLSNNPRTEVVEGQVRLEDMLVSRPGGLVRVRAPGMMREIMTQPFSAMALQAFELLKGEREERTGITRANQGLDAQSANKTATGLQELMAAAAVKVDHIARIFAETGVKDLCRSVYLTMIESPMKPFQAKLDDGEWVEVNPNLWDPDFDVHVEVGLGVGKATERMTQMKMVMDLQAQLTTMGFGGFLVTPDHFFNAAEKMTEAMGFSQPDLFFANPGGKQPPPPKPAPQVEVATLRAEIDKQKIQLEQEKVKLDEIKERALVEHRAQDLATSESTERYRIDVDSQTRLAVAQIQANATLQVAQQNTKANANGKDKEATA
jgi:hypothetical protein